MRPDSNLHVDRLTGRELRVLHVGHGPGVDITAWFMQRSSGSSKDGIFSAVLNNVIPPVNQTSCEGSFSRTVPRFFLPVGRNRLFNNFLSPCRPLIT